MTHKQVLDSWKMFKATQPHTAAPFNKRNWGSKLHSVCSYQGKLKPSIAFHLVNIFSTPNQRVLDPFSGSGTVPFEASLNGRTGLGMDIGLLATSLSNAKLKRHDSAKCYEIIDALSSYINNSSVSEKSLQDSVDVRFNKTIQDYYHPNTLRQVLLARDFFIKYNQPECGNWALVFSSMLHILHGNRPYALSRTSHPITPYAPTGEFIDKDVITHLKQKVSRSLDVDRGSNFNEGFCLKSDILEEWGNSLLEVDAIITSPPFFDSTKFYMTNWLRYWFCGWGKNEFQEYPKSFVEVIQRKSFDAYQHIFSESARCLKSGGYAVFHLGHSNKCNMLEQLLPYATPHFEHIDSFTESVAAIEKHGIRDKGSVNGHQYLVLRRKG